MPIILNVRYFLDYHIHNLTISNQSFMHANASHNKIKCIPQQNIVLQLNWCYFSL